MAVEHDVYLRSVPSDANPHDVRLYDPTTSDSVADDGSVALAAVLDTWQPDEDADPGYLASFEVIVCGPLEDVAATDDAYASPVTFDDLADEQAAQEPGFWATAPPDQDDEWVGAVVLEAATADHEADTGFTVSPPDQDDDTPPPAYAGQDGTDEGNSDLGDTFATAPLEDEPFVDADFIQAVIFDHEATEGDQDDGPLGLGPLDEAAAEPSVDDSRGKGSWDPYYYKRRKKRKKTPQELETYLAETAGPVPEPIRDEVAEARAAAIRALESDQPTLLSLAMQAINRADAAARLAAKQAAMADDEEDEEILLLWS